MWCSRSTRRIGMALAVGVVASTAQAGSVVYVDDDNCPGPGNGTQKNPYCSIRDAIDSAVDSDEILVAPGTYHETVNFIGRAIWLHSSDGPEVTIIDGSGSFHVVQCVSGEGPDTILDGFTITGGNADGVGFPDLVGGGMYNDNSAPTVTNCTFEGNYAGNCSAGVCLGGGGGMANFMSSPTLINCTFELNTAGQNGGGMFSIGGNPTVINCTFTGNQAGSAGGAVAGIVCTTVFEDCSFTGNSVSPAPGSRGGAVFNFISVNTMTRCVFTGNFAFDASSTGGGAIFSSDTTQTLMECDFVENQGLLGGAVTHCDFEDTVVEPLTVVNCTFINNSAEDGGGMANYHGNPTVTNCTFAGNTADENGGGMANYGGAPSVLNCTFTGNTSNAGGGGMYNWVSSPTVANCTFVANDEVAVSNVGDCSPPFGCFGSFPILNNCVLWGNGLVQLLDDSLSESTVFYSDIQGGWPGVGNIDGDPMFVGPGIVNYRLSSGSPCIDAGNNWGVPVDADDYDEDGNTGELFPVDLDGNPRFNADEADFDPGCGVPVVVDMGAYEYQFDPVEDVIFADLTGDGAVGILDLLALLVGWGDPANNCLADLDIDGTVGILDLLTLLAAWGPCP